MGNHTSKMDHLDRFYCNNRPTKQTKIDEIQLEKTNPVSINGRTIDLFHVSIFLLLNALNSKEIAKLKMSKEGRKS